MNILSLIKPTVRQLKAYDIKAIDCRIKLDANESPYNLDEILSAVDRIPLNRYPDPESKTLRRLLAQKLNLSPDNVLCGNGSDELVPYLIMTFGGPVLYPVPTFPMYNIVARALGERTLEIALDENFDLNGEKIIDVMDREKPSIIFLSIPNNPTGNSFSVDRVVTIIKRAPGIVVIDEAYQPFTGENHFLPLLGKFDNIIIFRTLSKIGFASLRIGYMLAIPEIITYVNKVRLPFNINAISQTLAAAALNKSHEIDKKVEIIKKERDLMFIALSHISGVTPYPSSANFIFFKVKNGEATYQALLKKGILIRNMTALKKDCFRVTVGTPSDNKIFVNTLKEIVTDK